MQDTASVSLCLRLFLAFLIFSCLQTNLFAIAMPGNGKQVRFPAMRSRRNTCNRKPCTHDNDGYRTSVTVAGKRCFPPLSLRSPLSFPVARCAIISAPFSFSPLHICLRFHAAFRTASVCHFRCWGKGKDGIRNTNFLSKNLHALSGVLFYLKNFYNHTPKPFSSTRNENDRCGRKTAQENFGHTERRKEKGLDPTLPIRVKRITI